jgi:hypothetical protein
MSSLLQIASDWRADEFYLEVADPTASSPCCGAARNTAENGTTLGTTAPPVPASGRSCRSRIRTGMSSYRRKDSAYATCASLVLSALPQRVLLDGGFVVATGLRDACMSSTRVGEPRKMPAVVGWLRRPTLRVRRAPSAFLHISSAVVLSRRQSRRLQHEGDQDG